MTQSVKTRHWTNAPESYDYSYVTTVRSVTDNRGRVWRLIEVSDQDRFRHCQTPRYHSGLNTVYEEGSRDWLTMAEYYGIDS